MNRPEGPGSINRGGITQEENTEPTSESLAQENKVNSVAITNVPDFC